MASVHMDTPRRARVQATISPYRGRPIYSVVIEADVSAHMSGRDQATAALHLTHARTFVYCETAAQAERVAAAINEAFGLTMDVEPGVAGEAFDVPLEVAR